MPDKVNPEAVADCCNRIHCNAHIGNASQQYLAGIGVSSGQN